MSAVALKAVDIGHNSIAFGEMIEVDPKVVFREKDALPGLFAEIEASIAAHTPDLTTESGRKAIASLAYGIAKRKTKIDDAGKELNEDARRQIGIIDAVRKTARDRLDALRDKARAPLSEWEAVEEARQDKIKRTVEDLRAAQIVQAGASSASVERVIDRIEAIEIDEVTFGDIQVSIEGIRAEVLTALHATAAELRQQEADRAELARIRAEREAEEAAAREARRKADADLAEQERIAAAERRAADEATAKAKRDADAAIAEERRKADAAERALDEERQRTAKAAADEVARLEREQAAADKRAANLKHRGKIMGAAKAALIANGVTDEELARAIVLAIAAGSIPHVTITF